jgi:hypothetical protein
MAATEIETGQRARRANMGQASRRYFKQLADATGSPLGSPSASAFHLSTRQYFANMAQPGQRLNPQRQPCSLPRETVQGVLGSFAWE